MAGRITDCLQDLIITARWSAYHAVASCSVTEFIDRLERVGGLDQHQAETETELTEAQITNIAEEFGQHANDATDSFQMRHQMPHDDFKAWVNAVGYLQMLQHALAYGVFEKGGTLWRQAVI